MLLGIKRDVWREVVIDSDAQTGASADIVKEELLSATYKVFSVRSLSGAKCRSDDRQFCEHRKAGCKEI